MMDKATEVRMKVFQALNGFQFNDVEIPVFDEVVNSHASIPSVGGAQQVYVMLQDQQVVYNPIQTQCASRFDVNLTIKVVTIFGVDGSKKLSEDIGHQLLKLIRDNRGGSKIDGVQRVDLNINRSQNETSLTNVAFSKIFILTFVVNDYNEE